MQTNILGGGGVVILPTQQISETFQREVRTTGLSTREVLVIFTWAVISGVKILIGVGSREKSKGSVKVSNTELCCKEQRKGMVS